MRRRDSDSGETRGIGGDRVEGRQAVKELLLAGKRNVRQVVLASEQDPSPILDDIIDLADEAGVDIRELPRSRFEQMAATEAPQGVVAFSAPLREFTVEELLDRPPVGGGEGSNRLYLSTGAEHVLHSRPAGEAATDDPTVAEDPTASEAGHRADRDDPTASDDPAASEADHGADPDDPAPVAETDRSGDQPGDSSDTETTGDTTGTEQSDTAAPGMPLLLVLDGITDPGNLGAILRTAECAGVTGIVLPRHRAARITPTVAKRAAGAIEHLRFASVSGIPTALATLAELGVWTVGLEVAAEETIWQIEVADAPLALVLGAEGQGLGRLVRRRCDATARIPVTGRLDALNVSAAAAVALFEVLRRRGAG